jgi:hypothetical protein
MREENHMVFTLRKTWFTFFLDFDPHPDSDPLSTKRLATDQRIIHCGSGTLILSGHFENFKCIGVP